MDLVGLWRLQCNLLKPLDSMNLAQERPGVNRVLLDRLHHFDSLDG